MVSFDIAPEHWRVLQDQRETILAALETKPKLQATEAIPPQMYWGSSMSEKSSLTLTSRPKEKQESRSSQVTTGLCELPVGPTDAAYPTALASDENVSPSAISVRPEALQIFNDMFPSSSDATEKPKKKSVLDWRKFVAAMTDAGFSASGSGGSAVTFTHDNGGRIIFHRPYPIAKVDPSMLAWFGKRLNKWFNLDRGSFFSSGNDEKGKDDLSLAGVGKADRTEAGRRGRVPSLEEVNCWFVLALFSRENR